MTLFLLVTAILATGLRSDGAVPIWIGNAQIDPMDLSVTYEFVNEAHDVTAYEVSITRYFADGSTLVSTQGQDWFSSTGYSVVRAVAYSLYESWLPAYPNAQPGTNLHRLPSPPPTKAALIDADVKLTAVIRLDGSAIGSRRMLERLFSQRSAMLAEYAYWIPRLQRAGTMEDSRAGLAWAVQALSKPRRGETLAEPRECLHYAAAQMHPLSEDHPIDAPQLLDAIIKVARQQHQFLVEQSVWRR